MQTTDIAAHDPATPASFAEHYLTSEHYADCPQEHRRGGTFDLAIFEVRQPAIQAVDPATGEFGIVRALNDFGTFEFDFGDGWTGRKGRTNIVDVQPVLTDCAFRLRDLHMLAIGVPNTFLSTRLDELGLTPSALTGVMGQFRHLPRAAAWIDRMWSASEHGGAAAKLDVDAAFLSLLAEPLRACGDERLFEPVPDVGDKRIARVVDYVEAHLQEPLAVGELAEIAYVSVFHFGRVFRRQTGLTPHRYLMARRVEAAKRMLATTDASITATAMACGFASHSHLSETFRRHVGVAPRRWRKEARS